MPRIEPGSGFSLQMSFAEIGPLASIFDQPNRNFTSVSEARARLRAVLYGEETTLATATYLVEERRDLMLGLFQRMSAERAEMAEALGITLPADDADPHLGQD
jgi:hypothetical protein